MPSGCSKYCFFFLPETDSVIHLQSVGTAEPSARDEFTSDFGGWGWGRALPPVLSHIYISYQTQRKRERNVINILVNAHVGVTDAPLILLSR